MFTSSSIIDNINQSEGLEYKKLCRLLKITKKSDKDKLDIALKALETLEIINKNEDDEYNCIKDSDHLVAKIRCSSKGYCFAVRGKDKEDIYIKENLVMSVTSCVSGLLYQWLELIIAKHARYIGSASYHFIKVYVKIAKYNNGFS